MADHFRAAPARRRVVGIAAVPEPELEFVAAAGRRLEGAAVDVNDVPGFTRRIRVPGSVGRVRIVIHRPVLAGSAPRRKTIPPSIPGVLARDKQIGAEGVIVLELPQAMQRVQETLFGIEIPLVPQEAVGFVRRHTRRAAELLLGAVEVEERELVLLRRRPVHLGVGILENRLVVGLREADDLDVVLPVRPPEPQLVLEQRPADVEAIVENLIGVIRLVRAEQPRIALQRAREIRRLQTVVVEGEFGASLERVRPSAGDEIDAETARLNLQIVAAGADCHLVEGVEVVIGRGCTARRRVRDHNAVEVPHGVGGQRALPDKPRLLARLVAANVHPVDDHAGDGLQQRPRILRLRCALQFVLSERGDRPHFLDVHNRRFSRDGDRFFHGLDRHRE